MAEVSQQDQPPATEAPPQPTDTANGTEHEDAKPAEGKPPKKATPATAALNGGKDADAPAVTDGPVVPSMTGALQTDPKPVESSSENPAEPAAATDPPQAGDIEASSVAPPDVNGAAANDSDKKGDVEMKEGEAATSAYATPAAPAVPGEKRKAEEPPAAAANGDDNALENKKPKVDEDGLAAAPAPAPAAPAAADVAAKSNGNDANGTKPRRPGRPRKEKKDSTPVGRTLRKTRSQGPAGV